MPLYKSLRNLNHSEYYEINITSCLQQATRQVGFQCFVDRKLGIEKQYYAGNYNALKKVVHHKNYNILPIRRNSYFLIFTPHGGGIEQGTSEICITIANNTHSCYLFEGLKNNCKRLHITSHKFDEPKLLELLHEHNYCISIHGMTTQAKKDVGADIYLGGLNKSLIAITTEVLRDYHFDTTNNIVNPTSKLNGQDKQNVTNKCAKGEGMQIEISENLRKYFFKRDFRKSRNREMEKTKAFYDFCKAINKAILQFNDQTEQKNIGI
jgi:phage replication-related protein YjqB (UPF0714/DUF867 family)